MSNDIAEAITEFCVAAIACVDGGRCSPRRAQGDRPKQSGFWTPELRDRTLALEADPVGSTLEEMREMVWAPVAGATRITID